MRNLDMVQEICCKNTFDGDFDKKKWFTKEKNKLWWNVDLNVAVETLFGKSSWQ